MMTRIHQYKILSMSMFSAGLLLMSWNTARAARVTDIVDGFERTDQDSVDIVIDAGWQFGFTNMLLTREFKCLAHDTVATGSSEICPMGSDIIDTDALVLEHMTHELNVGFSIGFWRTALLYARLPIVVYEQHNLVHADGMDEFNSTVDPYNQVSLFSVPFQSPVRSGFKSLLLGARFAPLSLVRDITQASWSIDVGLSVPLSAGKAGVAYRTGDNTAVADGMWKLHLATALSVKPEPWVEPYFQLEVIGRIADVNSLFVTLGPTQNMIGPGHTISIRIGTEFIPLEIKEKEEAVIIDVGAGMSLHTEGRDYSPMFEPLAGSACDPRDPEYPCDLTTFTRRTLDPDTGERMRSSGITDVEQFVSFEGWIGVRYQVIKNLELSTQFGASHQLPHFVTFTDAGVDLDGNGVVEATGANGNEFNPVYSESFDSLGTRFRTNDNVNVQLQLNVSGKF